MSAPILATKLYIPPPRPKLIPRLHLINQLNDGLSRKLTLISAPAGFGKTTLVSEWVASYERPVAWLSLDEGDNDLPRFLTYLIAALQTISANIGVGILKAIHASQPQPPSAVSILTALLNEITTLQEHFIVVLDDYHVIDAKPVDDALTFLLEHQPPQMHLIIVTREDPQLPLARLRVRNQLTELRAADLRFKLSEAANFLNQMMGLSLSTDDIAALEARTEGWIAGLQLAAISMQGHQDATSFIKSFTGTHHFVLDYLLEEVLQQQSEGVQTFLLRTSILDRLCGPLCDAVLLDSSVSGQETLEYLERANLFIVPLDNERRWHRYHHLFADLLRQRLLQSSASAMEDVTQLHIRASQWYEDNGFELEAFHHATAANDVERAERLIEGAGVPLHFRGVGAPVLNWLKSLPRATLNARPSLWVTYASALMMTGQHTTVEQTLQAAETALAATFASGGTEPDNRTTDLVGRIASMRATLAVIQHDVETIITQSQRALEYLHPDNLPLRTATTYTLGYAYQLQGDRAAASQIYSDVRDPPRPIACEAHLGLARIYYQWNDLDAAQQHGQKCLQLTQQMESVDTVASYEVFLAHLSLAQGDVPGAVGALDEAVEFVRQHNFFKTCTKSHTLFGRPCLAKLSNNG